MTPKRTNHKKIKRLSQPKQPKVLILGPENAGKSTIRHQILHFSQSVGNNMMEKENEKVEFRRILRKNVIDTFFFLDTQFQRIGFICEKLAEVRELLSEQRAMGLSSADRSSLLTPKIAKDLKDLQKLDTFQTQWKRIKKNVVAKYSQAEFYLKHATDIASPKYIPTLDHMCRAYLPTTSICNHTFKLGGTSYKCVDVGGQRSERKKWGGCFSKVNAVVFVVAADSFDEMLESDRKTNRMAEALRLFSATSGSPFFKNVPFVLYLNKADRLKEKIERSDRHLRRTFPQYRGGRDYHQAVDFIRETFKRAYSKNAGPLTVHMSCALDRKEMRGSFKDFVRLHLEKHGSFGSLFHTR